MALVHPKRMFQATFLIVGLLLAGLAVAVAPLAAQTTGFTLDITVTGATADPKTGELIVQGTVTCSEAASYSLGVAVRQYVGRNTAISGSSYTSGTCPGPEGTPFSISIYGTNGRFGPGQALIQADAFGCGGSPYPSPGYTSSCDSDRETVSIRVTRAN
jgi:hypothetical protein